MWVSSRPRTGIRVGGQLIELVDEFGYLACTLRNNGSYEKDIKQRPAKAISAFNFLTKCLWSTKPLTKASSESTYPQPHHDVRIENLGTIILGKSHGRCLYGCLATFGHGLRRPADRLAQRNLRSLSRWSRKKPPGRKRKFWTEVMKEDLRTLGVDGQFRRDVRFRRIWKSDEWIDSVQALAEDWESWAIFEDATCRRRCR
ncbi:hypothetical protein RB195_010806 [Necator americanus]|uniref:Uncharacterized protein n=1 Tax=Necator americanus TaxID=51031 RepID=A0ABR1D1U5_NECAM